jgi:murein DD-endopeptidase MepM/ murein hydrolase activator NlpD
MVGLVFAIQLLSNDNYSTAGNYYRVYLKGEDIGLIASSDELYDLINKEQEIIREKYNVENVYPPSDFEIVKTYTFNNKLSTVEDIYHKIEHVDNFTIKGYTITIKMPNSDQKTTISVIDREVFEEALKNFVAAFISDKDYENYINNTQAQILDVGSIIDKMYFQESISIKEGLVSVNNKIYTDVTDLSQYLLFGANADMQSYSVQLGDSLESIAEANHLNVQELLISNPVYRDENAILAVGDSLNVTYLNPALHLVEEIHKVEDVEAQMETKVVYDDTKPYTYSEVTTAGVTGITRMTVNYQVVNGEQGEEVKITKRVVIREPVTQVTTKGRKYPSGGTGNITGQYVDTGLEWGWPTNSGYMITSGFAWRWGKHHDGIDISGTGEGSPIYAAGDGYVEFSGNGGPAGWEGGNNVIIRHNNNYYTLYAHMRSLKVQTGQTVKKGQVIGTMGHTGYAFGTHLHFAASIGFPYRSPYKFFNPLQLYK